MDYSSVIFVHSVHIVHSVHYSLYPVKLYILLMIYIKYHLPAFLQGRISEPAYDKWLNAKANTLRQRDLKTKRVFAEANSKAMYKEKIHAAVIANGQYDRYTGDALQWELISTWDPKKTKVLQASYRDKFLLMPTVDHVDPEGETLEFEIVSWLANDCKSGLNPTQFVDLCKKITVNCG